MKIKTLDNEFKNFKGVLQKQSSKNIILKFNNGEKLTCTYNHKILTKNKEYIPGILLEVGDILFPNVEITSIEYSSETIPVYDILSVEDTSCYETNSVISHNCWFGDEFAFVDKDEEFYKSTYNTVASRPNAQVILTSTPNGVSNLFHKIFKEAVDKKNSYYPIHTKWQDFPGRDEAWKKKTIDDTNLISFRQEHGTEFIGSSNTLIDINKLLCLPRLKPIWENEYLKIYEEADPRKNYIIAVDVCKGRGLDYSTIQVIDNTGELYRQVCVYRDCNISPLLFPDIIYKIAKRYNNGLILVENNDQGFLVCKELHYELEYDNLFIQNSQKATGLGVFVDKRIKRLGCSNLAELIDNGKLLICDEETISELSTYEAKGSSYEAAGNAHDDLVSPLVLFSWFVGTDFYKNSYNRSMKDLLIDEREKMVESKIPPVGIFEGIEIPGMF